MTNIVEFACVHCRLLGRSVTTVLPHAGLQTTRRLHRIAKAGQDRNIEELLDNHYAEMRA